MTFFLNRLALKAIQSNLFVDYYLEEISLLMKLQNPFIINYIDAFHEGVLFCIITEYCEVRTIKK